MSNVLSMSPVEATARLDQLERDVEAMHDRIGAYRRSMLASRVAAWAGAAILVAALTIAPALNSVAVVLSALALGIGSLIWLGATKASKEELEARLAKLAAERSRIFDGVAAANGWAPRQLTDTRY